MEIDPRLRESHHHQHNHSQHRNIAAQSPGSGPSGSGGNATGAETGKGRGSEEGEYSYPYPDPPAYNSYYGHHHHPPAYTTTTATANTTASSEPNSTFENPDDNDNETDPRRPRACEACRTLKVRCETDAGGGSCKRCAKTGRQCVVTAPTRKRARKTDSRVAELERKIDALTDRLVARGSAEQGVSVGGGGQGLGQGFGRGQGLGMGVGQSGQGLGAGLESGQGQGQTQLQGQGMNAAGARRWLEARQPGSPAGTKRKYSEVKEEDLRPRLPSQPSSPQQWPKPADIIDKGIVSLEAASETFDHYQTEMVQHLPIVVFPRGTRMHEVCQIKPILFHAIISVSIGPIQPDLQISLIDDLYRILAERIVIKGEKSLELVQALIVACTWYVTPDHYEELKFYQLTHMAVTLAMDIGMFRRTKTAKKPFNLVKDLMEKKTFSLDLDSAETRRTWLGCYYISVQASTALRRVPLVRWHPYMDECIEILETAPDSLPSDKALLQWVKLAQITEEVGFQFSSDEPHLTATFSEPKIQYTLKMFEKQLEQWRRETPVEHFSCMSQSRHEGMGVANVAVTMKQSEYLLNTYIHEPTMHIDTTNDHNVAPGHDHHLHPPTSAAYINALTTCLTCVHRFLDITLSFDTYSLVCLPTYVLARASYAVVALMRLYAIVTGPETQIGQVIDPPSLQVEFYLDRIVEHYRAAGELAGGRGPGKFSSLLNLLRNWFVKQKDQNPSLKEALGGTGGSTCPASLPSQGGSVPAPGAGVGGQTPLHLLSEVAMGEPKSRPDSNHFRSGYTTDPTSIDSLVSGPPPPSPQQQQWMQYPINNYQSSTTTTYPDPSTTTTTASTTTPAATNLFQDPTASGADPCLIPAGLGFGFGFEPENLFSLGDMMGDGFINFPFVAGVGVSSSNGGGTGYW